jgi:hypothetical protein
MTGLPDLSPVMPSASEQQPLRYRTATSRQVQQLLFAVSHHVNDQDPAFHFNANPDSTFHYDADPDPAHL